MRTINAIFLIVQLFSIPLSDDNMSENLQDSTTIVTYEDDITGDGINETIKLKGVRLKENHPFFQDIWLDVQTKSGTSWTIPYSGGYEPKISFLNIPNEKGKSIFFSSNQTDDGSKQTTSLHSIINNRIVERKLPKGAYLEGMFLDRFSIHLTLDKQLDPTTYHINKQDQDRYQKFYSQDETLKENVPLVAGKQITLRPVALNVNKEDALKSKQNVYHQKTEEKLGAIEAIWQFKHNRWIKIKEQWVSE